jgi:hypothetical protein
MRKHPTPKDFAEYAKKNGCVVGETQITLGAPNKSIDVSYIVSPNGFWLPMPVLEEGDEYIQPRVVSSLCEKLGIKPFHGKLG